MQEEVMNVIYLSKGVVQPKSSIENLWLERGGKQFQLQGAEAAVWLKGRFEFMVTVSESKEQVVMRLANKGLIEMEEKVDSISRYRILTRCVCCPARQRGHMSSRLSGLERQLDTWMQKAGIHLSVAELVFLQEHQITADSGMFGIRNRQKLIETIYTKGNIQDNLLEHQMEKAECRDEVVEALMQLLKKKKVLIV